jgi:type II secretory pathway pseudopilin PulG
MIPSPHHAKIDRAKLALFLRSWRHMQFSFPILPQRISYTLQSVSQREITSDAQVRKTYLQFITRRKSVGQICSAGFTITELVLSLTISGILAVVIFTATFYYFVNTSQTETATTLALESQTILTQLTEDIRLADSIASTNAVSDPNGPGGGWVTSDPSNILIIESPAITSTRDIIYDSNTGSPYRNEFIYFMSGTTMYKRILANTSATGNTAKRTCPAASSSSTCPPDRLFTSNVSNLTFTFYDASDATTANAAQARSVVLTVNMAKKSFGKNITLANSTRVTLRNQ